jgi:hypothetical protein
VARKFIRNAASISRQETCQGIAMAFKKFSAPRPPSHHQAKAMLIPTEASAKGSGENIMGQNQNEKNQNEQNQNEQNRNDQNRNEQNEQNRNQQNREEERREEERREQERNRR